MRHLAFGLAVGLLVSWLGSSARADGIPYQFAIDSGRSGLTGQFGVGAGASGTLIGNYDINTNPGGTRTKPGLVGPFGSTENVPVPGVFGVGIVGDLDTSSSGGFGIDFDATWQTFRLRDFEMNLLASGSIGAMAGVSIHADSFRTRSPDSIFPGIPLELPIGTLLLTDLTLEQIGPGAVGVLTATGVERYEFHVEPMFQVSATVDLLGTVIELPALPVCLPLSGEIEVSGPEAVLTSLETVAWSGSIEPQLPLPQFPLDVPTILPPGETAHLLFDLIVDQLGAEIDAQLATVAVGTLVPEPASALLLLFGAVAAARRR
jgi:hypothetical protein